MPIKILIVEDSASDRLIIKGILDAYETISARDGLEALRQIDANPDIRLVILDLNMPNMNGFEVLKVFQSEERYQNLSTIILTNYDELESEIKGLQLGAVDYIRKPIHMESIKARIDVHVQLLKARDALELRLQEQELTFDLVFEQAPIGISISYSSEPFQLGINPPTSINPMLSRIIGRTEAEFNRLGWTAITHPDDIENDIEHFERLHAGIIDRFSMEKRFVKPDGSVVWVDMTAASLALSGPHKHNHICLYQNITARKEMELELKESERSKSVLLSHLPGMAYRCDYDHEWTMRFVSDGCRGLTGFEPEHLLDNRDCSYNDIIAPEYREILWETWARIIKEHEHLNYEYQIITADGNRKWVLEMGQGVYDEQGNVVALEGIILDISDRKTFENRLEFDSEHDRWTGLFNKTYLEKLLGGDAENKNFENRALVGIDLSAIQSATRTYGFGYTQALIKKTADVLAEYTANDRPLFVVYENLFVFYLQNCPEKSLLQAFCGEIAGALESLLSIERIGGGIGVVEIGQKELYDIESLMKKLLLTSEMAIDTYDSGFGVCFYDKEVEARISREDDIKHALSQIASQEKDAVLFLQYQPFLNLKTNSICGFEALARIDSAKLGRISPLEFIPIAEETKLIIPLGSQIFQQAFTFHNKLCALGYGHMSLSVNVSVIQLLKSDFCEKLLELLKAMQVDPKKISLEITESVFSADYSKINGILTKLKAEGLHISIDDFGTGYSSLARERDLAVDSLKIDKSFIDRLLRVHPDNAITAEIIAIAHKMGHSTVAEGVEFEEQRSYLEQHGCDEIQGYLIS